MDIKFRKLIELGAGKFERLDSDLITHLESTRCLLKEWNADLALQQAGFYYAAYLENELNNSQIETDLRTSVKEIVGSEVENIIYYFSIWDKTHSFNQQLATGDFVFYNKNSGKAESIPHFALCQLCELFVAIELDSVFEGANYASIDKSLANDFLFTLQPFLSVPANRKLKLAKSY
ncbi:MAG: DUF6817 domain-containing protein [Paraglaciecola sp.]|uniref:DUF6817 domain-containing protein n=1 Tax=Paraglaciecola sp. TaxID=1920173 RepID=UPI00329905CE